MSGPSRHSILVTWEAGGGYGHLMRLKPIVEGLSERGHRVVLATRDLPASQRLFPTLPCLQAPHLNQPRLDYPHASTLAEVMANMGGSEQALIEQLANAWLGLADLVQPDVVVMDFSPMALIAFQAHPAQRFLIDNGYSHPTATRWLPNLRPWQPSYPEQHRRIEEKVRSQINAHLAAVGQPALASLPELFQRVDGVRLMTLPELDHTGIKSHVRYCGYVSGGGAQPSWPNSATPRLLVSLRPFKGLDAVLAGALERFPSVLAVIPGCPNDIKARFVGDSRLHLTEQWTDLRAATAQADQVLCAGGDTVGIALLAGTAVCVVPFFPEQRLTGLRAEATGAARMAIPATGQGIPDAARILASLDDLIAAPECNAHARELARRHHALSPTIEIERIVQEIEASAARHPPPD